MPLKDEAGQTRGYLKILRDRTEQKLAHEALRTAEERLLTAVDALRDADRRKDEFLGMLAHELRNPLAAINNAVQISLRPARDQDLEWSKNVIQRQAKHLTRLLDDLLDAFRATHGKIELRKERIDLAPVIARAVETVRPLLEQKKHQLSLSIAPAPLGLIGDPFRIEQVLVNLLTNAVNYTPVGGHITLTTQQDTEVVVTVKDDGIGIRPEMLAHVFDLFAQADRTIDRALGGLGIGLTLVKALVEMHGGTVTAASEGVGEGERVHDPAPRRP